MEDMVDIVDENDSIIGKTSWEDASKNNLRRRVVRVFILNSKGEMLIAQRSQAVTRHRRFWAQSAGGSVDSGEKYEDAAQRELFEEVGIKTKLKFLFKINGSGSICAVFEGVYDGKIKTNWEVDGAEFIKIDKLKKEIENNSRDFTDGFKECFRKYLEFKKIK